MGAPYLFDEGRMGHNAIAVSRECLQDAVLERSRPSR
jgi:hypothetical protein